MDRFSTVPEGPDFAAAVYAAINARHRRAIKALTAGALRIETSRLRG